MSQPLETSPEQSGRKIDFSLTRKILGLTIPVAMGGHAETVVGMIQLFLIGLLGPAALSAVGIAQAFTRVLFTAMMSISRGALTIVAQAIGAESMEDASAAAKQAFTLLFTFSIFFGMGSLAISPLLVPALTSDPEVIALGTPYLQVFFIGVPFMTLNRAIASCFQGAGDTRTPFFLSILSSLVQVIMSYLLIFGYWGLPELGVVGAAVGGLAGRSAATIIGLGCLYSGRFALTLLPSTSYRFNWEVARRILKIGVPSGLQGILRNGSGLVYLKFIAMSTASTTAVAAFAIGNQMERILRRTGLSFGTVATALVGQHMGAKDPEGAERNGWTILAISVITNVILCLPAILFARYFMGIFTDVPEVIDIGVMYLFVMVLAEPFICASNTSSGSLRGAGDTMPPMYYTLISQWLIRLPVAYILAFTLGFDINGIWAALVVYGIVQGVLTVRKFARGEWKHKKI
ncbi:MAG: MATE family efflux transporter [Candidatus Latescibacteria bacterium]|jgi:putative MATE family efflux protein|nr:MATE family efflux transporter [Candidatus Latescibacterota bacterium]